MGLAFQLYSVDASIVDGLDTAEVVDDFIMDSYCEDVVADGFEAKWLDKSGMGILEAFGGFDAALSPPAGWMLGSDDALPSDGDFPPMLVSVSRVSEVAAWIQTISDEEFAERVSNNSIDSDIEYLGHWFGELRDFYRRAAPRRRRPDPASSTTSHLCPPRSATAARCRRQRHRPGQNRARRPRRRHLPSLLSQRLAQ
jgi:hypothetical protein